MGATGARTTTHPCAAANDTTGDDGGAFMTPRYVFNIYIYWLITWFFQPKYNRNKYGRCRNHHPSLRGCQWHHQWWWGSLYGPNAVLYSPPHSPIGLCSDYQTLSGVRAESDRNTWGSVKTSVFDILHWCIVLVHNPITSWYKPSNLHIFCW